MTAKRAWKAWLLPGGALFAAALGLVNSPWLGRLAPSLDFLYFAVFVSGLLLAWRFNASRGLFYLLTLLLAHRAIAFFSAGDIRTGPGHSAVVLVGLLIPLNAVVLTYMRERGLTLSGVAPRFLLLFTESVLVAVFCRPEVRLLPSAYDSLYPWLMALFFLGAAVVLVLRFLRNHKPLEIGLLWSLVTVFLWLQDPLGPAAETYVATAGLIMAVSLVETSYVLAYHDELTGIPGRRAFNEALLSLDQQYAIAIVDIDHFKKFNDTYGHDIGDQVLRMVASRLAGVSGGNAYRSGGEEFAIIFRNSSAKDAFEKLEALRQLVETSAFRVRGLERRKIARSTESERRKSTRRKSGAARSSRPPASASGLSVTISIGVAEPSARLREPEQVIAAADQALYAAKGKGRNRVELASGVTRAGKALSI